LSPTPQGQGRLCRSALGCTSVLSAFGRTIWQLIAK
jgi:hypothetical protein